MNELSDIAEYLIRRKTRTLRLLNHTHKLAGVVIHCSGFDTSRALATVAASRVLILAPKVSHSWLTTVVGSSQIMTPQLFLLRQPIYEGPILWLYGYSRKGIVSSVVFEPK